MMTIVYAVVLLGGLGLIFGAVLSFASKKFHVEVDERVEQVRACVAGANCGACGYPGCDGFAQAVVDGKAPINGCSPAGAKGAREIGKIMGQEAEVSEKLVARVLCQGEKGIAKDRYLYDGYKSCASAAGLAGGPKDCRFACIGLGDCQDKCAFDAITMKNGIAVIDPDKCTSCGACVKACPRSVIKLMPLSQKVIVRCRNSDVARVAKASCMDACIGCGRCKKTCQHDAIVVENGYARILPEKCTGCGECAAVCPCNCITVE
ncbi:MAG: RnfABCDGE type electron transport complex subunit B [Clostridia bacterium]|nr:RnfABCDGE type electron transport complex subunit B [Clostridia bacterium]